LLFTPKSPPAGGDLFLITLLTPLGGKGVMQI